MDAWPRRTADLLAKVRADRPMIHHLTNSVVTNLTANVTLCLGAAPVMAPCQREVEEMVRYAGALLLNIGTLDEALVESMIAAGREANRLDIPVVLDPVGAGATGLRTEAAGTLLREVRLAALRGNAGEVFTLAGLGGKVRGVDSMEDVGERGESIRAFARERGFVVAVTGPVDQISDGEKMLSVHNGHPLLSRVTGTGCSATTAVAAFLAAGGDDPLAATGCALAAFGAAAEIAAEGCPGPGTFVPRLLDALSALDAAGLERRVRIEEAA
jgi:hydroxyethylthiazole kinase